MKVLEKVFSHPTMGGVILRLETRRTCTVPRRALFCSSTSLIFSGIWASQLGNLSAISPSAPTTTGITMIFDFLQLF